MIKHTSGRSHCHSPYRTLRQKLIVFSLLVTMLLWLTMGMTLTACAAQHTLVSYSATSWVSRPVSFGKIVSDATVTVVDSVLRFNNTKGLWPEITCMMPSPLKFSVINDRIRYDFTPGKRTSIHLLFRDGQGTTQTVVINPAVSGATFYNTTGEINNSAKALTGTLSLLGLRTGTYNNGTYLGTAVETLADSGGQITLLGVTILVVGDATGMVQIRELTAHIADSPTTATKLTTTTHRQSVPGQSSTTKTSNIVADSSSATSTAGTKDQSIKTDVTDNHSPSSSRIDSGYEQSSGVSQSSLPGITNDPYDDFPENPVSTVPDASGQAIKTSSRSDAASNSTFSMTASKVVSLLLVLAGGGVLLAAWQFFFRPS